MNKIEILDIKEFFASSGREFQEIMRATGQPPTPPVPPNNGNTLYDSPTQIPLAFM